MQFEFYYLVIEKAVLEASCLGVRASLHFDKNGFVDMIVFTPHSQEGLTVSDAQTLAKFFSYLHDLAALHPSPSWPREVETVWFEYVAWQRSLKNDE